CAASAENRFIKTTRLSAGAAEEETQEDASAITIATTSSSSKGSISGTVAVERLATEQYASFLNTTTNATMQWQRDDTWGVTPERASYPSFLATFYSASLKRLRCQGALISSRHVLTTASCLHREASDAAFVSLFSPPGQESTLYPISRDAWVSHPRYTQGSEPRFDVALVQLDRDVPFTPVRLSAGREGRVVNRLARVHIASRADAVAVEAVAFQDNSASCATSNNSSAVCGGTVTPSPSPLPLTAFVGSASITEDASIVDNGASLLRVSSRDPTPYLFGLSVVSTRGGIGSIVKVSDCTVFLNAHISGLQWHLGDVVGAEEVMTVPSFVVGLRSSRGGQNFLWWRIDFIPFCAHCRALRGRWPRALGGNRRRNIQWSGRWRDHSRRQGLAPCPSTL
ncbi:hypothetical protein PINS_up022104, partial [Pythium insidiosum]